MLKQVNKDKRFEFLMTQAEWEKLQQSAEKKGVSAASLLRAAIRRMK